MSKILIDVDGTVAETRESLIERSGLGTDPFPEEWDLIGALKGDDKMKAIRVMNDPDFWSNLPLMDGAKKGIRLLKAYGHDITWVTSPWRSCLGWSDIRRFFIKENFGDDPVIITSDKEKVPGDIFIDDKVKNVEKWKKAHPDKKAFVFDAENNKNYTGAPHFNWSKVERLL